MELFYSKEISGKRIVLRGDECSHCIRVLRKKAGDEIFVIDGIGGFYRCEILPSSCSSNAGSGKGKSLKHKGQQLVVEAIIKEHLVGEGEPDYDLTMAVCPTKNMERFEWFVEKATELGVKQIVPIISDHSVRKTIKRERLESVALAATKQSLKAYLPVIETPVSVKEYLSNLYLNNSENGAFSSETELYDLTLIAHCEEGEKITIRQALIQMKDDLKKSHRDKNHKPKILIMIGPEGDFTKEEIELSHSAGFKAITLGKSRLRVETAAFAAVSEIYFGL